MMLGMGLGLTKRRGISAPAELKLAVCMDSLALRFGSDAGTPDNVAEFISQAEVYYGSGNVSVEKFAQGGLALREDWANANGATAVYFWEQDTSLPSAKLTSLVAAGISDTDAINAVLIFSGTNDADNVLEAAFGSTYTKAQFKTSFQELCAYLYNDLFPNARFIGVVPFHRNDSGPNYTQCYQAVMEAQLESAEEVSYIKLFPSIVDVDLDDAVHPTGEEQVDPSTAAFQAVIAPRMAEACASYHGKTQGSRTGPQMSTAEMMADHILVTVTHDKGTDITVPANAQRGFRADDDGTALTIDSVSRESATTFKIDLPDQGINTGSTYTLYHSYGHTEALSRTSAEIIKDNTTNTLALVQGPISVTEGDLIRQLTGLEVDINPRAGTKTYSGSDVTDITGAVTIGGTTATAGRYPQYDDTAFSGAGALFDPDGSTHMLTDGNHTTGSTCFLGIVVDFPASPASNYDFLSFGSSSFGNTNARFQINTSGNLLWYQNEASGAETLIEGIDGQKNIILANFKSASEVDFYINGTSVTATFDPRDSFNSLNRFWLFMRNTTFSSFQDLKIGRFFFKTGAHDASNDPSISDIVNYLNDTYSVGLSL